MNTINYGNIVNITSGLVIERLNECGKFIFEFDNKDVLEISLVEVEGIKCISIIYAEPDEEIDEDGYQQYSIQTSEYFLSKDVELAVSVFIEKLNSDNPKFITGKGKRLEDINVYNSKSLNFTNHYDYLNAVLNVFWIQVFGKSLNDTFSGGIIGAHGDKGYGYRSTWEKNGISYNHGMLIYLLTWTKEMEEDKHKSCEWVVDKYSHYLPMIKQAEKQVLKDVYGVVK